MQSQILDLRLRQMLLGDISVAANHTQRFTLGVAFDHVTAVVHPDNATVTAAHAVAALVTTLAVEAGMDGAQHSIPVCLMQQGLERSGRMFEHGLVETKQLTPAAVGKVLLK